jgi:prepilin-type N-terminal cleavage/methylation domain-containing protein
MNRPITAISVSDRRKLTRRRALQRGFSLIELLIVIAIILIIAAIAVPKFNQQRMLANEMAVLRELETLYNAQTQYYSQFGKYASALTELGPPTSGAAGPNGADLIPKLLAEGSHNGYRYTLTGAQSTFTVSAVPESFGNTGRRTFFMDQTKSVKQNWSQEPATAQSPELR